MHRPSNLSDKVGVPCLYLTHVCPYAPSVQTVSSMTSLWTACMKGLHESGVRRERLERGGLIRAEARGDGGWLHREVGQGAPCERVWPITPGPLAGVQGGAGSRSDGRPGARPGPGRGWGRGAPGGVPTGQQVAPRPARLVVPIMFMLETWPACIDRFATAGGGRSTGAALQTHRVIAALSRRNHRPQHHVESILVSGGTMWLSGDSQRAHGGS